MIKHITVIPVLHNSNDAIIQQYEHILNVEENIQVKNILLNLKMI